MHTEPIHHFHTRKRIHQKLEQYPHPDKFKRILDKLIYIIGIIGPVMTIPQIYNIYIPKLTEGVSIISWSAYLLTAVAWLTYGIAHKEKPIIVIYSIWIILEALIIIGLILY